MKGKVQKGVKANNTAPTDVYAGANSNVAKEAKSKAEGFKRGGKAKMMDKIHGAAAKAHAGRKPRMFGGASGKSISGGNALAGKVSNPIGRPVRASGGSVMSSAAKGQMRPGFEG